MKYHWNYLKYVVRHKWFVLVAGRKTGAPLFRLLIHDFSKFSRAEWTPYVNRFSKGRAGVLDKDADPDEFHLAWNHHWHRNPHHWEYWIMFYNGGSIKPLEMPYKYANEMLADWAGAGRAIAGEWKVAEWYERNKERIQLHPTTRGYVESVLRDIKW